LEKQIQKRSGLVAGKQNFITFKTLSFVYTSLQKLGGGPGRNRCHFLPKGKTK
jgi:hypothetical protein